MKVNELRKRLGGLSDEMQDLVDAGLDDDSRAMFDTLEREAKTLKADIARMEKLEADRRELDKPAEPVPSVVINDSITVGDAPEDRKFNTFGEQLRAVHRAAVGGHRDPRLTEERAVSGHSEGVPADGGFLVQSDFASEIFKIAHDSSVFLPRCRQTPVSGNGLTMNVIDESSRAAGSRWGGVAAYWKPEAGTATAKKVKFAQINLKLRKLIAIAYATDELLEDQTALGSVMSQAFAEEISFMVDDAIFRGDGAAMPAGITGAACYIAQGKETGQAADTIVYENLVKMWSRLHAGSKSNAVWLVNPDCMPQLMLMSLDVGTGGAPVYLPPGGASGAPYGSIFGRPVIENEFSATVGDAGDIVLADFSQYQVITKGGLNSAMSAHVKFAEDEMAYRWTYRIDGQALWKSALTPFKGSSTVGPFVGLAARA